MANGSSSGDEPSQTDTGRTSTGGATSTDGGTSSGVTGSESDTMAVDPSESSGSTTTPVADSTTTGDGGGSGTTGQPLATCRDRELNGDETDIDCGGACEPCDEGLGCIEDDDCASALCTSASCLGPDVTVWHRSELLTSLFQDEDCTDPVLGDGDPVRCWEGRGGPLVATAGSGAYEGTPSGVRLESDVFVATEAFDGVVDDVLILVVLTEVGATNSFDFNLNHPTTGTPGRYTAHVPWNSSRRITFDAGSTSEGRIRSAAGLVDVGETHLYGFVNSATQDSREIVLDGLSVALEVGATNAVAGDLSVGSGSDGTFREIRIYEPAPALAVREVIEGRLACTWDLRDQLPATHPFYAIDGADDVGCP